METGPNDSINNATPGQPNSPGVEFLELIRVVEKLRGPNGCPWDREQTHLSLCQYAIEEAFELVEAIETGRQEDIIEELGDFLFQVVLHAQVATDHKNFTISSIIQRLIQKMIHRHPHVFSDVGSRDIEQVWLHWDKLKDAERSQPKKVFSHPRNLPALQTAHKIGVKTQGYKFDWEHASEVVAKVEEELAELKQAIAEGNSKHIQHEVGDLLFSTAQLARHLNLESEQCLRIGNRRFEDRFLEVLRLSGLSKDEFRNLSKLEKESLWQTAKKNVALKDVEESKNA
jgi:tetrapyrrole methylase family protein/MazG family protein